MCGNRYQFCAQDTRDGCRWYVLAFSFTPNLHIVLLYLAITNTISITVIITITMSITIIITMTITIAITITNTIDITITIT